MKNIWTWFCHDGEKDGDPPPVFFLMVLFIMVLAVGLLLSVVHVMHTMDVEPPWWW